MLTTGANPASVTVTAIADTDTRNGRMVRMMVNFMVAVEMRRMYRRLAMV